MWPRTLEVAIALWLAMSPFVFGHGPEQTYLWANDLACAGAVFLFATASFWRKARRAHLLSVGVALWLMLSGWLTVRELGEIPAYQNHILTGFVLALLAIVPGEALRPPTSWRRYYLERDTGPAGPETGDVVGAGAPGRAHGAPGQRTEDT